jgi:hypothetical protein
MLLCLRSDSCLKQGGLSSPKPCTFYLKAPKRVHGLHPPKVIGSHTDKRGHSRGESLACHSNLSFLRRSCRAAAQFALSSCLEVKKAVLLSLGVSLEGESQGSGGNTSRVLAPRLCFSSFPAPHFLTFGIMRQSGMLKKKYVCVYHLVPSEAVARANILSFQQT